MKTRMIKCFAIMFAFSTVGYMAVSVGVPRNANAEETVVSTVTDTGSSLMNSDTSGSSDSGSSSGEDAASEGGTTVNVTRGGCCG